MNDGTTVTGTPGIQLGVNSVIEASGDVPESIIISDIFCDELDATTQVFLFGNIDGGNIDNCKVKSDF